LKSEVGRSTVIGEHRPIAILLQNCYERHPEFRLLLDALRKEGPSIHFPDLLRRLVHEYPNVFLNTFCTRSGRTRARELLEAGEVSRVYEEESVWKDIIRTNVLFNFVQQVKCIDIRAKHRLTPLQHSSRQSKLPRPIAVAREGGYSVA
jgi:hypothetical protein